VNLLWLLNLMQFRLLKTLVKTLRCEELGEGDQVDEKLKFSPAYHEDLARQFAVLFDLTIPLESTNRLHVTYLAVFETEEDITEDFKNSHFPKVNAAAVAYPYLRAFVSQFSVLAGFEIYTLPIRNFAKAAPTKRVDSKLE